MCGGEEAIRQKSSGNGRRQASGDERMLQILAAEELPKSVDNINTINNRKGVISEVVKTPYYKSLRCGTTT